MIIGHGPLAFALTAGILLVATTVSKRSVLYLALVAGIASVIPDIDILFPLASLVTVNPFTVSELVSQFWTVAGERHRHATHSLLLLTGSALVALVQARVPMRLRGYAVAVVLCLVFMLPFSVPTQLLIAVISVSLYFILKYKPSTVRHREIGAAFMFGLVLHPFGDMFTGTPPAFFYPFTDVIGLSRWTIAEPTLQFALIFILEIGSLIAALVLVAYLTDIEWITYTDVRPEPYHALISLLSVTGLLFVFGAHISPTVDSATFFVLPLVGATVIGNTPLLARRRIASYVTGVSWSLLFAIVSFTTVYIALNIVV